MANLALAVGLGAHASAPGQLASLRRQVWLDALASAALCRLLAPGRGLVPEEAFSAGLLHDLGKVIALATIEELLEHQALPPAPAEAWGRIVERYHVELGLVMAARWDLPQVLADVISLHHADASFGAADRALVGLVAAVDEVILLLGERTQLSPEDLGTAALLRGDEGRRVSEALGEVPAVVASLEAATHLVLGSPSPAPENLLLRMTVGCSPPLSCFATVKRSWPGPGGHRLELQPYALAGEVLARWKGLVAEAAAT